MKRIKRLNIEPLKFNDVAFDYYIRNFNFQYYQERQGKFKNIPVREAVSLFIEKIKIKEGIKYPWNEYASGFSEQYRKGMAAPHIEDNEAKKWHILTGINVPESDAVSFDKEKAFEYGENIALSFLAWEIVILDLPSYEFLFDTSKTAGTTFSDFLTHEKASQLANYLMPLIQKAGGTKIGVYFLALEKMEILRYTKRQEVCDTLNLNKSKREGIYNTIRKHKQNDPNRSQEIEVCLNKIQFFINSLKE
jgi:hypothetical protein